MIPNCPVIDLLAVCPDSQCVVVGYYWSHSMGSLLQPDQFDSKLVYLCEYVEYREDGSTKGLVVKPFDADKVTFL